MELQPPLLSPAAAAAAPLLAAAPLRSTLKRRTPDTAPPAWSSPLTKSSKGNSKSTTGGSRVRFERRVKHVLGTAEQLDRSGHDAFVCDGCESECNRWETDKPPGRWHCLACDDDAGDSYDLCRRCWASLGEPGGAWPHRHGKEAFGLEDEPTESEVAEAAACLRETEVASGARALAFGSPVTLR
jgi:hypothetical protein